MSSHKPCILVAPLNWGLGHATRCIPLIRLLEELGANVLLASDGVALHLLRAEFPHLTAVELPSYRIRYHTSNMVWNIARQLPRIFYAIRAEHRMVRHIANKYKVKGIISDNRYGCFHEHIKNVILTHQLHVQLPNKIPEWPVNNILHTLLARFDRVWVPDLPGAPNLSGLLSHPPPANLKVDYIAPQSRMQRLRADTQMSWEKQKSEYDVGIILSGPEPQRTILEQRLLEQAMMMTDRHFIFVQGKTQERKEHYFMADHIEMVSFLTSRDLNLLLLSCTAVVCRSGYSSIMDLAVLGLKAVLIPTPGQTEQEYLAKWFSERNIFATQNQDTLDLETALNQLPHTNGLQPEQYTDHLLKNILQSWLAT